MNKTNKDESAAIWMKKHEHLIPPEELPPDRFQGKRVKFMQIKEDKHAAPKEHPFDRTIREEDEIKFDSILDAEHQNRNFYELGLTAREAKVYDLLRAGLPQAKIARKLRVTKQAVNKWVCGIKAKMGRYFQE
jgi:DNA-binding CsgD family transcriptional regulator